MPRLPCAVPAKSICAKCPACQRKGKSDCSKGAYPGLKCPRRHFWRWCPSCKTVSTRTIGTLKKEYEALHGKECPKGSMVWWQMTQLCPNSDCDLYMKHWNGKN